MCSRTMENDKNVRIALDAVDSFTVSMHNPSDSHLQPD